MLTTDFAKYVIALFNFKGDTITNLHLQKVLYYMQAWSLVYFDDPTFKEHPQAWVHGPVYPSVYHDFKEKGYSPIDIYDFETEETDVSEYIQSFKKESGLDKEKFELFDAVYSKYGSLEPFKLVVLTHKEEPWIEQRKGLGEFDKSNNKISFKTMKEYYSKLLEESQAA